MRQWQNKQTSFPNRYKCKDPIHIRILKKISELSIKKIIDTQVRHATSNESWVIQNLNLHIQNYDLDLFDLKNNVFTKISDAYLLEVANHNFTLLKVSISVVFKWLPILYLWFL